MVGCGQGWTGFHIPWKCKLLTLCRQDGRKGPSRRPEKWSGLHLGIFRSTVENSQTENPTSIQTASYRVLYLIPGLCTQRFCPGLNLHQPGPPLSAWQGSHTCTANRAKIPELDAGWSGNPAFTWGWTTPLPTAHKVTDLSGYIFNMQMWPPQPVCGTSAFYS